jgi:hypothetical protein
MTHFLVIAMNIASIFKRPRPSAAAVSGAKPIKFERNRQPSFKNETAPNARRAAFSSGAPVIHRSILLPLHASGLSASQNLIFLVTP